MMCDEMMRCEMRWGEAGKHMNAECQCPWIWMDVRLCQWRQLGRTLEYTQRVQTNANEFMPNGGIVVLLFVPVPVPVAFAVAVATSHCCTVSLSILSLIIK